MIPAYSPQARGRSERGFSTWQGRLPQELRLRGITTIATANQFLREQYLSEFNQRFMVKAAERGTALVPLKRKDLDLVFSLQHERVVAEITRSALPIAVGSSNAPNYAAPWLAAECGA
jgi:hypothetical protein